jgi:hypothetical protein
VITEPNPQDPSVVGQPSATTTVVVQAPVRIIYDCDDRFTVWNDAGYDLSVGYGFGVARAGAFRVGRGRSYTFVASRVGPVRFWVGDRQVGFFNYVRRPCGYPGPVYYVPPIYRYPVFYGGPVFYPQRPVIVPYRAGGPRDVVTVRQGTPRVAVARQTVHSVSTAVSRGTAARPSAGDSRR